MVEPKSTANSANSREKKWLFGISHGRAKINREWREFTRKNKKISAICA